MSFKLYSESFQQFKAQKTEAALAEVDDLSEGALLDPALAGALEKIARRHCFEVAELRPAGRRGLHRDVMRSVKDYDRHTIVKVEVIEVTIPFVGSPESFRYSLSSCTEIGREIIITGNGLLATFDDDDNIDREVNIVIERVSKNLDQLRKEMTAFKAELPTTLGSAADERATAMRARKERDKKRSFPID